MKLDTFLDKIIERKFVEKNKTERENHTSSGKLSASMLNDPIQWQILKTLGAPTKELEEYVLRKFFRGKQIEEWAINEIPDVVEKQKLIEYKDCVGYADALVDTKQWDFKLGIIPVEIKSVANAKFKRIISNGPDKGHILQAAYYALGLKADDFAVIYVASDDLRVKVYIYETKNYKLEIDEIIAKFQAALKSEIIPVFEPREKWQANLLYSKYPAYQDLTEEQLKVGYKKLKSKIK